MPYGRWESRGTYCLKIAAHTPVYCANQHSLASQSHPLPPGSLNRCDVASHCHLWKSLVLDVMFCYVMTLYHVTILLDAGKVVESENFAAWIQQEVVAKLQFLLTNFSFFFVLQDSEP